MDRNGKRAADFELNLTVRASDPETAWRFLVDRRLVVASIATKVGNISPIGDLNRCWKICRGTKILPPPLTWKRFRACDETADRGKGRYGEVVRAPDRMWRRDHGPESLRMDQPVYVRGQADFGRVIGRVERGPPNMSSK